MDYAEQQAEYDWLMERWGRFECRPFPRGWCGVETERICLVMLDADTTGLIRAFVNRRQLRPGGVEVLRSLHNDLRRVLASLTAPAADYFGELDELATTALSLLDCKNSERGVP